MDLSNAFDTLDHAILLHKLEYHGIKHNELKLFNSYLTDHKQFVDIEGTQSEMLEIKTGVPQGSVLGPLLFIIYMNDISVASEMFKPIIFDDDSTLISILRAFNLNNDNNNNSDRINSELNKISNWFKLNKLSLNTTKLKCMVFHMPHKHVMYPKLEIDHVEIQQVKEFYFLRIVLNEQLTWKNHTEYLSCKITVTNGILNRLNTTYL